MTPTEAHAFFERYRDAFTRLDAAAVTAHQSVPCIYSQGSVPSVFTDIDSLLQNNRNLVDFYREDGMERVSFEDVSLKDFGERHTVADVAWTIHRRDKPPVRFRTGYNLRRFDGDWKIWAVTVYEERSAFDLEAPGRE